MRNAEEIDKINRENLKVTERLEELTADIRNLVIEGEHTKSEEYTEECNSTITKNLQNVDRVKLKNKYKGKKGMIGEVKNSGRYFSSFKEKENSANKRAHHNLKKIAHTNTLRAKSRPRSRTTTRTETP